MTRLCLGGFFGSLFFLFQKKVLLEVLWDSWVCGLLVFINFEKFFLQTFLSLFSFSDFSYIYIRPSAMIDPAHREAQAFHFDAISGSQ